MIFLATRHLPHGFTHIPLHLAQKAPFNTVGSTSSITSGSLDDCLVSHWTRLYNASTSSIYKSYCCFCQVRADHPRELGYFLAGAMAGVVSRTVTAPLDRLKVYLIAQTGVKEQAVQAAKEGAVVQAAKQASRPIVDAIKALWRAGGFRSLFAG